MLHVKKAHLIHGKADSKTTNPETHPNKTTLWRQRKKSQGFQARLNYSSENRPISNTTHSKATVEKYFQ